MEPNARLYFFIPRGETYQRKDFFSENAGVRYSGEGTEVFIPVFFAHDIVTYASGMKDYMGAVKNQPHFKYIIDDRDEEIIFAELQDYITVRLEEYADQHDILSEDVYDRFVGWFMNN